MQVYNTLSGEKEEFTPKSDTNVNMFVCGPTVYDYSHIGHGKTYTQFDIIVKYLRWKGYDVFYLMNITDIDDKIIDRADEEDREWKGLAEEYERKFLEDLDSLGCDAVDEYARATDHVDMIIKQVQDLLDRGFAYHLDDGIYFEIDKFDDYGKLSNQDMDEIKAGARVEVNEDKKNPADFCLWKHHKPGEPWWDSPWGKGRPGWHIEDTAITESYFGPQYDVHGGAEDLIFPHHESEIAQQEAASGKKPLVQYWLHTAFLNIDDEKMSKSEGNIISIRDAIDEWGADTLRYYYAVNHYRTPLNYSESNIEQAQQGLERVQNFIHDVQNTSQEGEHDVVDERTDAFLDTFEERMDDDFDTPGATAALFDYITDMNKQEIGTGDAKTILDALRTVNKVLGIFDFHEATVPERVKELVKHREVARANGDWSKADELREEIKDEGYTVEDTEDGPVVKEK